MFRTIFRTPYTPIAIWILFVLSVVIYEYADNQTGFYQILVTTMYFSPVLYLFCVKKIDITDGLLVATLFFMFLSAYWHPEHFRPSTVFYSGMFIATFMLYKNLIIRRALALETYIKFISVIIYAYCIVLIIQQIQVTLHTTVFNQNWVSADSYKLNSLSMEPSNTLLIIPLFLFSYIKMLEIKRREAKYQLLHCLKEDKWVWMAAMYVCFTCGSTSVFFSIPFFFCYFFSDKKLSYIFFIPLILILCIAILGIFRNELLERFINLTTNMTVFWEDGLITIDSSSACRIVPIVEFFKTIELSPDLILGHGIDQMEIHNTVLIVGDPERHVGAKNIFAQFYDYGWIAGLSFMFFLFKTTVPKLLSFESFFYISTFSIITLNHYILWLFVCMMFTNLYFERKFHAHKRFFDSHHHI